jgi:hypothetical protein
MTVGIVDKNSWLIEKSDGFIDLQSTEKNLRILTHLIDEVAKQDS